MDLPLQGRTIQLRNWECADLPELERWLQPGQRWKELDAPYYPGLPADEVPLYVRQKQVQFIDNDNPRPLTEAVIADLATNQMLGVVTWAWESEETNWPSAGIAIYDPANWRRGIGYQALGLWTEYLFATLPEIVRLDLRTWSGNQGLQRLAEKLGYSLEARFRKARIVKGAYYDSLGYGVLREEWQARYPQGFAASLQDD